MISQFLYRVVYRMPAFGNQLKKHVTSVTTMIRRQISSIWNNLIVCFKRLRNYRGYFNRCRCLDPQPGHLNVCDD
ncbi:hypothetical protein BD289DRAFT_429626, partial [Coniella lustricola]